MTQQRNISALESCLLDEIINMSTSIDQAILYGIGNDQGYLKSYEICYRGSTGDTKHEGNVETSILKQLAFEDSIVRILADGRQCLFVPIKQDNRILLVLKVMAQKIEAELEYIVRAFARIYHNFTNLINESEKDNLTGLFNRRTFEVRLKRLLLIQTLSNMETFENGKERRNEIEPADKTAWLVMLDIDNFKNVNDTFGHVYGDEVLLVFSQKMREVFRKEDILFRFGGEEFLVVLEPCCLNDAKIALERYRKAIEEHDFPQVGHVTVSIGFAKIEYEDSPLNVLNQADKALYYAKNSGRNQVLNYEDLVREGSIEHKEYTSGEIELF